MTLKELTLSLALSIATVATANAYTPLTNTNHNSTPYSQPTQPTEKKYNRQMQAIIPSREDEYRLTEAKF